MNTIITLNAYKHHQNLHFRFREGSQSFVVTKASTVSGSIETRDSSITLPPTLNAALEATVVAGTANMSRAILAKIGNFALLIFHQFKTLKDSTLGNKAPPDIAPIQIFFLAII